MIERVLERALRRIPLPPVSKEERSYLDELEAAFRGLPLQATDARRPSEAAWIDAMNRLRQGVLNGDPRQFLRWDVVVQTMFVDTADYISAELRYLKHRADWRTRWRPAINETWVGNPTRYLWHVTSSRNLIHHAYHVAKFEEKTNLRADALEFVLEFGGGYGSMCRLFHNLGFRGSYVIFDLPAFSALQLYFLRTLGLPARASLNGLAMEPGITCISDLKLLEDLLKTIEPDRRTLFMATWSLSEVPRELRKTLLPLAMKFRSFLIAYQERFGEVDNLAAFAEWQRGIDGIAWHDWPIGHIPGNHYLVGSRREP